MFALTRLMTKKINDQNKNKTEMNDTVPCKQIENSTVYEKLIGYNNEIHICVYLGYFELFEVLRSAQSEKLSLRSILSTMEKAMEKNKLNEIQWPNNDVIFE